MPQRSASWREINLSASGSFTGYIGATQQTEPGIYAWKAIDPSVEIVHIQAPFDGGNWFIGYRVYDNGNGTWDYEYAVHNLDSDRSGKGFMVRAFEDVGITNTGFRDVDYHSGDGPFGVRWTMHGVSTAADPTPVGDDFRSFRVDASEVGIDPCLLGFQLRLLRLDLRLFKSQSGTP